MTDSSMTFILIRVNYFVSKRYISPTSFNHFQSDHSIFHEPFRKVLSDDSDTINHSKMKKFTSIIPSAYPYSLLSLS